MNSEINKNTENKNLVDNAKTSYKRMTTKQRKIFNAVFIVIFLLIFAGLNVLSVFLVNKFPSLEVDLTAKGAYSLQETTEEYLEYMEDEIFLKVLKTEEQLLGFSDDNGNTSYAYQVNQLLREMSQFDKLNLEYMDLTSTSNKALSEKYPDIDWSSAENLILVENADGSKYKLLTTGDVFSFDSQSAYYYGTNVMNGQYLEQEVLSAIQRVTSEKIVKVALSTGNGEVVNEESEAYSYFSYISVLLDDNAYDVENINLLTQTPSEDTDIIIMMAPRYDLTDSAVDNLSQWLSNDGNYGKTFLYVPYDYADDTPNIDLFLEQWGMAVTDGYINENDLTKTVSSAEPPELNGMVDYANDTYTAGLKDTTRSVLMPYCMPVEILDSDMATPLLTSSTQASVRLPSATDDETAVEYIDSTGDALNAAAISTKTNDAEQKSNVIVWGSYDGLGIYNLYYYSANYGNASYFINLLNTLTENETESIVVEGVSLDSDVMVVTSAQKVIVFVIFVVLIPVAIFVTGIVIWLRRRNR